MDALKTLAGVTLVPVVTIDTVESAVPMARALLAGGIPAIEVTLRTDAAMAAIAAISADVPDIICGAGSLRRTEQVDAVRKAGAQFGVSPGSSPDLLSAAEDFPFVPGAETASEVIALLDAGYMLQKFFPAEVIGGLARIKALSAPLPEVMFFPTGGIDATLAKAYLAHPKVQCVGGSWFVPGDAVASGDFEAVTAAAKQALEAVA